jgi:hypothetical protein
MTVNCAHSLYHADWLALLSCETHSRFRDHNKLVGQSVGIAPRKLAHSARLLVDRKDIVLLSA